MVSWPVVWRFLLCGFIFLGMAGCSFTFPAALLPPPLPVERENHQVESTLFPLPVMATDPNSGNDYGFLPVWVFPRRDKAIGLILAPSAIYNDQDGVSLAFRLLAYPSKAVSYRLIADQSTDRPSHYEFTYRREALLAGEWFYGLALDYDCDISPRFYGFGNTTPDNQESSYTARERDLRLHLGYRPGASLEINWYAGLNQRTLSDHHLRNLPSTATLFPAVMRDRRNTAVLQGLAVSFDTRDYKDTPTCGLLVRLFAETALQFWGSDASFDRVGFEIKAFQPWDLETRRCITALHLQGNFLTREWQTPFYRWPSLGGHSSYRGAGEGRWVDRNLLALTLEQRIEVFRLHHFGVVSHWEVAPFLDLGKVFPTLGRFNFKGLHPAGGVAFRALVRPQVVGHVEVGFGSGGNNAVFMGLDYPF